MAHTQVPIHVLMDDGRELSVVADQRDYARAEAQELPERSRLTWVRFIAWSALVRTKQYGGAWEEFNSSDCVEASDVPEESADAEDRPDPGRTDQSAGN